MKILGLTTAQWKWRMMHWKRNARRFLKGSRTMDTSGLSLTNILIGLNLLLFSLMVVTAVAGGLGFSALFSPPTPLLIKFGAQYWPFVMQFDQWWRCITYAFTHGGLIHLAFNMIVLMQVGPLLEVTLGKARFWVLYLLTALTATFAGYLWHPMVPVVGASGSLFGLIGFSITYFHRIGGPTALNQRDFMLKWALFAFVFGLLVGADNAAHLGGALGGALLGWVMPLSVRLDRKFEPVFRALAWAGTAATAISLVLLGRFVLQG